MANPTAGFTTINSRVDKIGRRQKDLEEDVTKSERDLTELRGKVQILTERVRQREPPQSVEALSAALEELSDSVNDRFSTLEETVRSQQATLQDLSNRLSSPSVEAASVVPKDAWNTANDGSASPEKTVHFEQATLDNSSNTLQEEQAHTLPTHVLASMLLQRMHDSDMPDPAILADIQSFPSATDRRSSGKQPAFPQRPTDLSTLGSNTARDTPQGLTFGSHAKSSKQSMSSMTSTAFHQPNRRPADENADDQPPLKRHKPRARKSARSIPDFPGEISNLTAEQGPRTTTPEARDTDLAPASPDPLNTPNHPVVSELKTDARFKQPAQAAAQVLGYEDPSRMPRAKNTPMDDDTADESDAAPPMAEPNVKSFSSPTGRRSTRESKPTKVFGDMIPWKDANAHFK